MTLSPNSRRTLFMGMIFGAFILTSAITDFEPGKEIGANFYTFFIQMLKLLPCVFVLIGLFDVWIKAETVERHLGQDSGILSYFWAVLMAGTTVGGLHVALPVGEALYLKRARLGVVLAFISAGGICRVPMTLFEASILGWKFTVVRFAVSLPLIILSSGLLGLWMERSHYELPIVARKASRKQ